MKLVSAKEGKNIEDLFNTVGELALKRKGVGSAGTGTKVTASGAKENKKKKSCC